MKHVTSLLLILCLSSLVLAQTSLDSEKEKKMVVFLYAAKSGGGDVCRKDLSSGKPLTSEQVNTCVDLKGDATGFLIAVPDANQDHLPIANNGIMDLRAQVLLVTARHVFDPAWAHCSISDPEVIFIRLNKVRYDPTSDETGVDYFRIRLRDDTGKPLYWVRDDDDEVDAGVLNITEERLSQEKEDFRPLSLSSFASSEEIQKLQIGDTINSPGLLPDNKSGLKRNYPFFKFGAISNIPNEPLKTSCGTSEGRLERVWFVAINLAPGNSGSPIFYDVPPLCQLIGFIQCHRGLDRGAIIGVQSSELGDPNFGNEDVAAMTPIEDVFKIIQKALPGSDLFRGDVTKRLNALQPSAH